VRRDFDTVSILVHSRLWIERNGRIFQQEINGVLRVFEPKDRRYQSLEGRRLHYGFLSLAFVLCCCRDSGLFIVILSCRLPQPIVAI
jgi:hypothetical protein